MKANAVPPLPPDIQRLVYDGYQFQLRNLFEDAARCYRKAMRGAPDNPDVAQLLGMVRARQGRTLEAIDLYTSAIARKPRDAKLWHNLGLAYSDAGRLGDAIRATANAAEIDPTNGTFAGQLLSLRRSACDWTDHDRLMAEVHHFSPFFALWADDPEAQLAAAKSAAGALRPQLRPRTPRRPGPIRLGYVSADFRDHPITHLVTDLFRAHDRERFEVTAFALGPETESPYRRQVISNVDRFIPCGHQDAAQIARTVEAGGIDILIDVMGFTTGHRLDLFALRSAPIQLNYLGYPGTTGASFIDYVVADPVILPFDQSEYFSEKIVHLPDCYQPNATGFDVGARPRRADYDLPEDAVVLCSFNNLNKLDPATFDSFCRILTAVPRSVLWMLSRSAEAEANLRREAEQRGVAGGRLMFAPPEPMERHLARMPLADLFLDSFPYTAHTTASDAVRMGLPLVTRTGRTFASRVAASVLHCAGLDDLVTTSAHAFEQCATVLALDPDRLKAVRARVETAVSTSALFDPHRYARNIEAAFATMVARYEAGLPPSAFAVP